LHIVLAAQRVYSATAEDWNPEVFAIGVPMVSADGSRVLAFNCSGRVSVMTREKLVNDFGPRLVALRDKVYAMTEGKF
jgi:DNA-binding IclR family transcriptional regulator